MNCTHLYQGFREVGRLPSIAKQREIQRRLIEDQTDGLNELTLLTIGCGFGEELNDLLSSHQFDAKSIHVTAIDIASVAENIKSQPFSAKANTRLTWRQLGLLDLQLVPGFGGFDIVQSGFVFHDIEPTFKERAYSQLANSVCPGGLVVFSDIFIGRRCAQGSEELRRHVGLIYDRFLHEADQSLRAGKLSPEQWRALVGDGTSPGLKTTKSEATAGLRDFFESVEETRERLLNTGFRGIQIVMNPINDHLAVLAGRREHA